MKTLDETIAYLALRIGYVYYDLRPRHYGGDGAGLDVLLHTYHLTWAHITERESEFDAVWHEVLEEEECGSADFSTRYAMNHPTACEDEIAAYTIDQWKKVSDRLGVPIPHEHLAVEFARDIYVRRQGPTSQQQWIKDIRFQWEPGLDNAEFIDLLIRSTLAERRPVDAAATVAEMLANASIICTARASSGLLVGVSRAISDFSYCTYLSDLAVDAAHQGRGIGRELIRMTHAAAGLQTMLVLLAAPRAQSYYPHIGMRQHDSCWVIDRQAKPSAVELLGRS